MPQQRPHIEIYTDGGCDPNPGPGGWGAILLHPHQTKELSGGDPATTNNRMEMTAAVEALKALKQPCTIDFYTDSQYLRKGITEWMAGWKANGWRKGKTSNSQPIKNLDLWQELDQLVQDHDITWHWVKGHAGNTYNERADQLASAAIPHPEVSSDETITQVYLRISGGSTHGPYGWAASLVRPNEDPQILRGGHPNISPNHFTLVAVLALLGQIPAGEPIQLHTNNGYLYDGITKWVNGWKRKGWAKPDKFREDWQLLDAVNQKWPIKWQRFKKGGEPEDFKALADAVAEARALAETMTAPDPLPDFAELN